MSIGGLEAIGATPLPNPPSSLRSSVNRVLPFGQLVQQLLEQASVSYTQANQAVQNLALGRAENLHEVLLSVAQADLHFRLILEIRNRLTEAYQEILRMPI